jgi:hypothetical protein
MQFKLDVKHLFKEDKKEEKDMYSIKFETYNSKVEGKFEFFIYYKYLNIYLKIYINKY